MRNRSLKRAFALALLLLLLPSCAQQGTTSTPGVWDTTGWDAATWR